MRDIRSRRDTGSRQGASFRNTSGRMFRASAGQARRALRRPQEGRAFLSFAHGASAGNVLDSLLTVSPASSSTWNADLSLRLYVPIRAPGVGIFWRHERILPTFPPMADSFSSGPNGESARRRERSLCTMSDRLSIYRQSSDAASMAPAVANASGSGGACPDFRVVSRRRAGLQNAQLAGRLSKACGCLRWCRDPVSTQHR